MTDPTDPHARSAPEVRRIEVPTAPATGTDRPEATELAPDEEPTTTGTLFLTMILLMIIGGIWFIVYYRLVTE
ncbi:MAG TPA: hypothetical protein VK922_17685 [Gemmatimonadaceae bacterium]|nr:hypothetical protein [Gemmatimonadaceae bacterium]